MVEIKVYKTAKEAKQQLEKYELDNREAFEGFVKRQGESASERLGKQTYYFVAELAAYVDDKPEKYYFESAAFPFLGWNSLHDDIQSLVRGVKDAVRHQTPKNIETILYTIENHAQENQETRERAKESRESLDSLPVDEAYFTDKEEQDYFLNQLVEAMSTQERGLTEQERQEFVKLYERE